ncbi:DUF262 domain-containing protein [Hymenobacter gummosus]|uniref:DUF262 domain-containing protein n=1 Tax=Hymenobacter gummosus TaxID=1776032 RepID=A0A431TWU6_9BACT|nr:DUF262 domain-containing protein [Hymenobacter gummosus]RTQ45837.1 DUF262 domain-containing protein [Hymenobacter gummosus]
MAKHSKQKLVAIFAQTIEGEGAQVEYITPHEAHPAVLDVKTSEFSGRFRIYIWNLSRGGNSRPSWEYRIQVTGVEAFQQGEGETTLILGYWAPLELFVAYDFKKHDAPLGTSVSLQVREEALHEAVIEGITVKGKENAEQVVVFSKESALTYLKNHDAIHAGYFNSEVEQGTYVDLGEDEPSSRRYSLTSYGVDYPIDSLVKRLNPETGNIYVPSFQRQFIWTRETASRFIESLILGLPVPSVVLAHDSSDKLIIVDGQQRLLSLRAFYSGLLRGDKFTLKGVAPDLEGKGYNNLTADDQSRLDNQTIHAIIIKPNDPVEDSAGVYTLFERLNTGGQKLTAQEIRASMYYGAFNDYLNELTNAPAWVEIFGYSNRFRNQELILRFFALYYNRSAYEKPMSLFLNKFMSENRNLQLHPRAELDALLLPALTRVASVLGRRAFRLGGGINAAVFDSVVIALAMRLARDPEMPPGHVSEAYSQLLRDDRYVGAVRAGTSDKASIETRIEVAREYFDKDYYGAPLL